MAHGDEFSLHELLHTTSIAKDFVEEHLLEHPSFTYLPKKAQLDIIQAHQNLFDAYQGIGHFTMGTDED